MGLSMSVCRVFRRNEASRVTQGHCWNTLLGSNGNQGHCLNTLLQHWKQGHSRHIVTALETEVIVRSEHGEPRPFFSRSSGLT
jgi:hypothetical protein